MRYLLSAALLFWALGLIGQPGGSLKVSVREAPPYSMQDAAGNWHGLAVGLWREIAEANQWTYEWVQDTASEPALAALRTGAVDVIAVVPLDPYLGPDLRQSYAYHESSLGVALPNSSSLWSTVAGVFSMQFLYVVAGLIVLLLIVGVLVYFLERGGNEEQFGGERSVWEGIGSGFWWAGVTMTTIGYGDKAPRTLPGRAIAMLWMLVALAVTSSLTATIITATEARNLVEFPEGLKKLTVGTVAGSPADDYLRRRGQQVKPADNAIIGLERLREKELEAFVDDVTTLRYLVKERDGLNANIQVTDARPVAFSFAVRTATLRDSIDRSLLHITQTERWRKRVGEYGGQQRRKQ